MVSYSYKKGWIQWVGLVTELVINVTYHSASLKKKAACHDHLCLTMLLERR